MPVSWPSDQTNRSAYAPTRLMLIARMVDGTSWAVNVGGR